MCARVPPGRQTLAGLAKGKLPPDETLLEDVVAGGPLAKKAPPYAISLFGTPLPPGNDLGIPAIVLAAAAGGGAPSGEGSGAVAGSSGATETHGVISGDSGLPLGGPTAAAVAAAAAAAATAAAFEEEPAFRPSALADLEAAVAWGKVRWQSLFWPSAENTTPSPMAF